MNLIGVARPQATLTIKHMDAQGNVMWRKRRGIPGLFGKMKPDIQIAHGKVTDDFAEDIVDNLIAEGSAFGDYKFHDSGTGSTGENVTDSAMETACGEARDTGSQVESSSKVYKSIATHTYAGAFAITEHGLFNIVAAGILMDRTVFAVVNVAIGEKIEFTYELTVTSGG